MEQAKAQFDVNFFGTVTVNKAVLLHAPSRGGAYCEHQLCCCRSAHSVPDLLLCKQSRRFFLLLRSGKRSQAYGIHVTVVELGDICTGFTKARQKSILGDEEYGGRISRSVSQMEQDEQNGMDPARIGRYIAGIVEKKNPAVVYVAGAQYKFLSLLCKLLPAAARGKIVGKIYG